MTTKNVSVRLSAQGAEQVKAALRSLGADGERALKQLERGTQPASRGLLAVDRAAAGLHPRIRGMAAGIGGGLVAALGGRQLIQLADTYAILDAKLRLVTNSGKERGGLQQQLFGLGRGGG